jgi:hypothetical protein
MAVINTRRASWRSSGKPRRSRRFTSSGARAVAKAPLGMPAPNASSTSQRSAPTCPLGAQTTPAPRLPASRLSLAGSSRTPIIFAAVDRLRAGRPVLQSLCRHGADELRSMPLIGSAAATKIAAGLCRRRRGRHGQRPPTVKGEPGKSLRARRAGDALVPPTAWSARSFYSWPQPVLSLCRCRSGSPTLQALADLAAAQRAAAHHRRSGPLAADRQRRIGSRAQRGPHAERPSALHQANRDCGGRAVAYLERFNPRGQYAHYRNS